MSRNRYLALGEYTGGRAVLQWNILLVAQRKPQVYSPGAKYAHIFICNSSQYPNKNGLCVLAEGQGIGGIAVGKRLDGFVS
jgi:hypothetical protein